MRKRGGEISSPLAYEEVDAIATIVELVREVVEPVIEAPFDSWISSMERLAVT